MTKTMKSIFVAIIMFGLLLPFVEANPQSPDDSWESHWNELQPPNKVMDAMGLKAGMSVGDLGAGRGRYSVKMAERVGTKGLIYSCDIDESKLEYLKLRCKRDNITNIRPILGTTEDPRFPGKTLDFVFMVNTFHHIDKPVQVLRNIIPSLKRGGKLVILEHTPEKAPNFRGHNTPKKTVLKHATDAGFKLERIETFLKLDNMYIFKIKG